MKSLRIIVFVLAMIVLTTQAVRHIYVRYIEPRTSVLDKYDQTETQKAIKAAESLDKLLAQYAPARAKVDDLDKELKSVVEKATKDDFFIVRDKFRAEHEKDYERESLPSHSNDFRA
jgi:hypothetical protein